MAGKKHAAAIDTLLKLSSALNISLDYLIYGYQDDVSVRTPEMILVQETVLEMLGSCSEEKRKYALDLLRLFLKACDGR